MLEAISVRNYRSFKGLATLQIRPITVLLGRNSSGKSSLTRLIPLLRQTLERVNATPILWTTENLDLGSIHDAFHHGANSNESMEFRFSLRDTHLLDWLPLFSPHYWRPTKHKSVSFDYVIRLREEEGRTAFRSLSLIFASQELTLEWNSDGRMTKVDINGRRNFPDFDAASIFIDPSSIFPDIVRRSGATDEVQRSNAAGLYPAARELVSKLLHHKVTTGRRRVIADTLQFVPREQMLRALEELPNSAPNRIKDENRRNEVSDGLLLSYAGLIIRYVRSQLEPLFIDSSYIAPVRASGSRFDRIQELAVNRIDPTGTNVAMYVYSLNKAEKATFNLLMSEAFGYVVDVEQSGPGHVSLKIAQAGKTRFESIADVGFGFSQVLPIVAQIHAARERPAMSKTRGTRQTSVTDNLFAIEQPELHLHPALQANLADLFVEATRTEGNGARLKLLIETHSETIVGRLGSLVASSELKASDVAIYLVDKNEETGQSTLSLAELNDEGIVENWPLGFFSASARRR